MTQCTSHSSSDGYCVISASQCMDGPVCWDDPNNALPERDEMGCFVTNKSKRIGRQTENAVAAYLAANGWPHAEPRVLYGANDQGDITGTPGICWQVKGGEQAHTATDGNIDTWMSDLQFQVDNANADVGVLVVKRQGYGAQRVHLWWAYMTLHTTTWLGVGPEYEYDELSNYYPRIPLLPPNLPLLPPNLAVTPVRMHLHSAVALVRHAGYGNPIAYRSRIC